VQGQIQDHEHHMEVVVEVVILAEVEVPVMQGHPATLTVLVAAVQV